MLDRSDLSRCLHIVNFDAVARLQIAMFAAAGRVVVMRKLCLSWVVLPVDIQPISLAVCRRRFV